MPLNLPDKLPAIELLKEENIFVIDNSRASSQDIRPLKIVVLNLMPIKITTETDLVRLLSNTPLQVEMTFMKLKSHTSKNTPIEHMQAFYHDFDVLKNQKFDGMIITGAPVEQMPFEDVDYWEELKEIMEWTKTHVTSTVHLCWGAQAGFYYHFGIDKIALDKKLFGLFEHRVQNRKTPLVRGFDDVFLAPHSRHTTVSANAIKAEPGLIVLAESDEAGVMLTMTVDGKQLYMMGHPEYDRVTLHNEYMRDKSKGLPIELPKNYYPDDNCENKPLLTWRSHANNFYTNWINYYVYQATPYILEDDE